jgi:translation initiation factor IF-2
MKTLTELSGSVIRAAAAAVAEARRSLPRDAKPAKPATPESPPQDAATPPDSDATAAAAEPAEAAALIDPTAVDATPVDAAGVDATPVDATAEPVDSVEVPMAPPAAAAPEPESGAANEAIDAAVTKATGISGDRLTMLRGAVEAVGRRAEDVRLVRVFGPEEQVSGATKIGDYQYVVDVFPQNMKQVTTPKDDRGRRGGGGGGRGGGGGGKGGGDRGAKGGAVGGFSMDSLRDDRKGARGGPGGRKPGGRGPGGPPRGAPKK